MPYPPIVLNEVDFTCNPKSSCGLENNLMKNYYILNLDFHESVVVLLFLPLLLGV